MLEDAYSFMELRQLQIVQQQQLLKSFFLLQSNNLEKIIVYRHLHKMIITDY